MVLICTRCFPGGKPMPWCAAGTGRATGAITSSTNGPLWYMDSVSSPEGNRIFANGELLQGELVRYDSRSHQFLAYLSSISAGEADFSSDGEWIVYISYPELTLWRARTDGSQKMQLT
jgi:hypothetical protein